MATGMTEDDRVWQARMLQGVSRTFALTIPQLPPALDDVVGNAYLLCRITDTIEDEPALSGARKRAFADRFIQVVAGSEDAESFARDLAALLSESTTEAERELVADSARAVRIAHGFEPGQREALSRCVRIMATGMVEFQLQASRAGLDDLPHLGRYCYHVAGVVGELVTDLFCHYSDRIDANREQMRPLAVSFGQGLQMTNILKDVWEDHRRGACWLPRDVFHDVGCDLETMSPERYDPRFAVGVDLLVGVAIGHLENALRWVQLIPRRETGMRRSFLWALVMAVLTLRRIHATPKYRSGREVKISRRSVRVSAVIGSILARSNLGLSLLFWLVTRGLPCQAAEPLPGNAARALRIG